ncbi:hypothetical protein L9F63_018949, partial [Diploptera punctata]
WLSYNNFMNNIMPRYRTQGIKIIHLPDLDLQCMRSKYHRVDETHILIYSTTFSKKMLRYE